MGKRNRSDDNDDETSEERKLRKKLKKEDKEIKKSPKKKKKKKTKKEMTEKKEARRSISVAPSVVVVAPVENELSPKKTPATSSFQPQSPSPSPSPHPNGQSNNITPQNLHSSDGMSPFQRKKVRLLVSLLPASLRNIHTAINAAMQSLLFKHLDGINGVLLSFHDIQIVDGDTRINTAAANGVAAVVPHGRILDEMPHIHYYITVDVLVFEPTIGQKLTGVVNYSSNPSHLSILVYGFFNASVKADSLRESGFLFDSDLNEWTKNDTGATVQIDDTLTFKVEKIDTCTSTMFMECSEPSITGVAPLY